MSQDLVFPEILFFTRIAGILAMILVFSTWQFTAVAQSGGSGSVAVSGKVTDENKEPLPGVSIRVHNSSQGAVSDVDGNFKITLSRPNELLTFSFIGYKTQQINAGNRSVINVALAADHKLLNEVVVVGYGTQERKNVIGSISKIDPSETKSIPTGSFDAQLQGKVAGV